MAGRSRKSESRGIFVHAMANEKNKKKVFYKAVVTLVIVTILASQQESIINLGLTLVKTQTKLLRIINFN